MKEFQINEFITLKLEEGKTNIYVKEKLFKQCKHLLINIDTNKIDAYDEIKSIDDVEEELFVGSEISIPPKVEFWGHCSNIQTWVEHNYDTHLLGMMLAFPLLKTLADAGDKKARARLSEEVLERFNEGNENVREYLIFENFFGYLKDSDKFYYLLNEEDATPLVEIIVKYKREFKVETFVPLRPRHERGYIVIKEKKIDQMGLWLDEYCKNIPEEISKFKHLRRLRIFTNTFDFNTSNVVFKNIKYLSIYIKGTKDTEFLINNIKLFPEIESFGIYSDKGLSIKPKIIICNDIEKLKKLKSFSIKSFNIKKLPKSLSKLNSLRWLIIYNSNLDYLPDDVFNMNTLEVLNLERTNMKTIPRTIENNKSIKYFVAEPSLVNTAIKEWIKKQKLELFKDKTYKKKDFFNFPVAT